MFDLDHDTKITPISEEYFFGKCMHRCAEFKALFLLLTVVLYIQLHLFALKLI